MKTESELGEKECIECVIPLIKVHISKIELARRNDSPSRPSRRSQDHSDREVVRGVTVRPACAINLRADSLELRGGENPIHARSIAPTCEEMNCALVAGHNRMRDAEDIVQRLCGRSLRGEQRAVRRGIRRRIEVAGDDTGLGSGYLSHPLTQQLGRLDASTGAPHIEVGVEPVKRPTAIART